MNRHILFAGVLLSASVGADELTLSNTFQDGTVASAGEVNENFLELEVESNENDDRITAIEGQFSVTPGDGNAAVGAGNPSFQLSIADCVDEPGRRNTSVGVSAAEANTLGTDNTAIGHRALASGNGVLDNSGSADCFYGGSENTALGSYALEQSTEGAAQTALGFRALDRLAGGTDPSTAVGAYALSDVTSGGGNTALGYKALAAESEAGVAASGNTAVGSNALKRNTGFGNVALGSSALFSIAGNTGEYNVAVGYRALTLNTTGSENTAVGYQAGPLDGTLSNTTALGADARPTKDNQVVLGSNVDEVVTSGKLIAGEVTYPNIKGAENQVLTTDAAGTASWSDAVSVASIRASISQVTGAASTSASIATCPSPKRVIGGGCAGRVVNSRPQGIVDAYNQWLCVSDGGVQVTAYAICL